MKKLLFYTALLVSALSFSQVGIGTTTPHASAQLDVTSTSKGLLPPRLTNDQKTAIVSPAAGLFIWCIDCGTNGEMQVFNGTTWTNISGMTVPGAPTNPVATAGNAQASVAFTAPTSTGGSLITSYTVTSSPGNITATGTSSPITVTGLTNGTAYTFTVVATNAVGTSDASVASTAVTPVTVPGAPTISQVIAGYAEASVTFTAPNDGGSPITSYTVTSSPGNITATGTGTSITVTSLTNGTSYTFTVVATNAVGTSVASVASTAVKPNCYANVDGSRKFFMCYNLGVTVTDPSDPLLLTYQLGNNNGAYYQWGRNTDGHEIPTSSTQYGPVSAPVANRFITSGVSPFDWISPQNNSLWLDNSKEPNDPCPSGFRVPTQAQWGGLFRGGTTVGAPGSATQNTWTWTGNGFKVGNFLYLPAAGNRSAINAALYDVGRGTYWSSSVTGTSAYALRFESVVVSPVYSHGRGNGCSLRCISE